MVGTIFALNEPRCHPHNYSHYYNVANETIFDLRIASLYQYFSNDFWQVSNIVEVYLDFYELMALKSISNSRFCLKSTKWSSECTSSAFFPLCHLWFDQKQYEWYKRYSNHSSSFIVISLFTPQLKPCTPIHFCVKWP